MDHSTFIREGDGSVAVLMVHGIAGTPRHFDFLIPEFPESWGIYNILLPGHGGTAKDFGASSMEKWRSEAMDWCNRLLERYKKVVLVGHSMGTLFSIRNAVAHPDRVPFAFLLSVPSRPWVRMSTLKTCTRATRRKADRNDPEVQKVQNATSTHMSPPRRQYICWIPRFLELLKEIRKVRKLIPKLTVPCHTFQSRVDELVSIRSCKDLEGHPHITNTVLEESGHMLYSPGDMELLRQRLRSLVEKVLEQEKI